MLKKTTAWLSCALSSWLLIGCLPSSTVQVQEPDFVSAVYADSNGNPITEYRQSPGDFFYVNAAGGKAYRSADSSIYYYSDSSIAYSMLYIPTNFNLTDYYYPDGWMGDYNKINVAKFDCPVESHYTPTDLCLRWKTSIGEAKWSGVYWLRDKNWGWRSEPHKYQGKAKYVTFWARSSKSCQSFTYKNTCTADGSLGLNCRKFGDELKHCTQFGVKIGGSGAGSQQYGDLFQHPSAAFMVPLYSIWTQYVLKIPDSLEVAQGADFFTLHPTQEPIRLHGAFAWFTKLDYMAIDDTADFYLDNVQYRDTVNESAIVNIGPSMSSIQNSPNLASPGTQMVELPINNDQGEVTPQNFDLICINNPDSVSCDIFMYCKDGGQIACLAKKQYVDAFTKNNCNATIGCPAAQAIADEFTLCNSDPDNQKNACNNIINRGK